MKNCSRKLTTLGHKESSYPFSNVIYGLAVWPKRQAWTPLSVWSWRRAAMWTNVSDLCLAKRDLPVLPTATNDAGQLLVSVSN